MPDLAPWHDDRCEQRNRMAIAAKWPFLPECHCGSRLCPLCDGCKDGKHLQHNPTVSGWGMATVACACPLCEEEAA